MATKTPEQKEADRLAKEEADRVAAEAAAKETTAVPNSLLVKMQEDMARMEAEIAAQRLQAEVLADMVENGKANETEGKPAIRKRKDMAPQFHTVRIRKFPIAGDVENLGYVVGWTNRGAYQKVDRTGPNPVVIDFIDIFFLGHERNAEGKLQAESVKLLDLMNAEQVYCKIISSEKNVREVPTGEEIELTIYDQKNGVMQSQGETIDGYVAFTDYEYTIQIPAVTEPVVIDGRYVN